MDGKEEEGDFQGGEGVESLGTVKMDGQGGSQHMPGLGSNSCWVISKSLYGMYEQLYQSNITVLNIMSVFFSKHMVANH